MKKNGKDSNINALVMSAILRSTHKGKFIAPMKASKKKINILSSSHPENPRKIIGNINKKNDTPKIKQIPAKKSGVKTTDKAENVLKQSKALQEKEKKDKEKSEKERVERERLEKEQKENEQKEKEFKAKIEELNSQLNDLNQEEKYLKKNHSKIKDDIDNQRKLLDSKNTSLKEKKQKLERLKDINSDLKEKLLQHQRERDQQINEMQETEESPLSLGAFLGRILSSFEPLPYEEISKLPITTYNKSDQEEKCSICDFELCLNDVVVKLPKCNHTFHKECLFNYFSRHSKCPICNAVIAD